MRKQRLNSGQMRTKVEKFKFIDGKLVLEKSFFAKSERRNSRCVYSERGIASQDTLNLDYYIGAGLTPANIVKIDGLWWAVAFSSENEDRIYAHSVCGRCTVLEFKCIKKARGYDAFNTPKLKEAEEISFDGIFCEKYIRASEGERFVSENREYVIVHSKETGLKLSDIISIGGKKYYVTEIHEGTFLNEAVVIYRGDA